MAPGDVGRRVGHQQVPLVRVLEERVHAVGDGVAGGLVARHRQQHEEQVEVHLGEGVALDLGVEQRGHDVLAWLRPALLGQLLGVHEHLDLSLGDVLLADLVLGVLGAHHPVGPVEQLEPVLARHAQQLGDHLQRQLGGDVDDEVAVTAVLGQGVLDDRGRSGRARGARGRRSSAG